ncbi:UNVERIFIED_CONTAM: hypothetical protein FKN15_053913 [Acipenser sinensis]
MQPSLINSTEHHRKAKPKPEGIYLAETSLHGNPVLILASQPAECTLPLSDQVSAEALWTVLREQSKLKLMKMDNEWTMNTQVFEKKKKQGNTEAQQKVWEGTAAGTITHHRLQRAVDLQHGVQEAAHLSMPATGKASKLLKEKKLAPQRLDGVART